MVLLFQFTCTEKRIQVFFQIWCKKIITLTCKPPAGLTQNINPANNQVCTQPRSQCPLLPVPAERGRIPQGRVGRVPGNPFSEENTCLLSTNKSWRAVLSTCGAAHWIYKHFLNPNVNLNSKAKNYIVLRWIKVLGNDLPSRVRWSWIRTEFFMKHDNNIHHTDIRQVNWL